MELFDRELAFRCGALDEAAWRELFALHQRRIARSIFRALGHRATREDVADLTQEVFARLLANGALGRLRGDRPGSLARFLSRTARRVALDHLWGRPEEAALPELISDADPSRDADERARRKLFAQALARAAAGPHAERNLRVLHLHFFDGLSPRAIASELGCAEDLAESILRRTRARLVASLQRTDLPAARRSGAA